jgi:pimeloyl-ACP methyl ester carboxylesterase
MAGPSFRGDAKHRTSDAQLRIAESRSAKTNLGIPDRLALRAVRNDGMQNARRQDLMTELSPSGFLPIGAANLEYRMIGPAPDRAPTIVMLHEGLGSVGLWGDFPDRLQAATGAGVFVYSRAGYGASSPAALPRPLDYMHGEALDVLPKLLEQIGLRRGILLGHSDGASIAAIYAGGAQDHRLAAVAMIAPHFVVEEIGIAAIAATRTAYQTANLREKLARWHEHVDNAFYGWSDAWLDPKFRTWDISDHLAYIRVPVAILQGTDDQYGTMRQIEIARAECYCPLEVTVLAGTGHSPHRDAPQPTLRAISEFVRAALAPRDGRGGRAA